MIHALIKTFWQSTIINGTSFIKSNIKGRAKKCEVLIDVFYFFVMITSVQVFAPFSEFPKWDLILNSKELFDPIWSLKYLPINYWESCVRSMMLLFLAFSILTVLFWKKSVTVRVGVFLSMFFYLSLLSSFGKIDHNMHVMLITTFLLIFTPKNQETESKTLGFIKIFFGIQAFILLTYFSSGLFKFYGLFIQETSGYKSAFSYDSLAQQLSKTSFFDNSNSFLASLVLENNSVIFPSLLILGYFIEVFSIYVIFKPCLHKAYGLILILLHVAILLIIGPNFNLQIITVGIFFLFSPFHDEDLSSFFTLQNYKKIKMFLFSKKRKDQGFLVFYNDNCLVCRNFIKLISKIESQMTVQISKMDSDRYHQFLLIKPDLKNVDSVVVVENNEAKECIRIKATGVMYVLSKLKKRFIFFYYLHKLTPYFGNSLLDLLVKVKKIDR